MTSAISSYSYDYNNTYQQKQSVNSSISKQIRQYLSSLREDYPYVNSNGYLVGGVQTNVDVSLEYIKKCMNNPEEAGLLEAKLSEIPNLVMNALLGGYGNISNLSYAIDDDGNMSVSITSDKTESAIKSAQEKRKLEEEKANKLLENLEKVNQALSEALSWKNSNESSFLLSLNKNTNAFSISGIQNSYTQNNISNIINNNISSILQYALNYSDDNSDSDIFNLGYTISTGLYLLNRIWNA